MGIVRKFHQIFLLFCAFSFCASPALAEVVLVDLGWQFAIQIKKQRRKYHDIEAWIFPPSSKRKVRVRAMATLHNKSGSDERAVLLRYAFSARLKRVGKRGEGIWTIPFVVEERRIPRIRGGAKLPVELYLNRVAFDAYIKRMNRAGFWPDAFRVKVMIEPRGGETLENRILETTLPVIWKSIPEDSDEEVPE